MTRTYTVSINCPRCDSEVEVEANVSGGYYDATREQPAEYPEVDYAAPAACECGAFSPDEINALDKAIEEAAREADESALEDAYASPDGPEDLD